MAASDAAPGPLVEAFRRWVHEDLRESVVELYDSDDPPGEVAGRVWRRCEQVRQLLALVGIDDDRVRRAADLLAPIHHAHLAVDALDDLAVDDGHLRAALAERAAALDALLAPGCATPEAAASLLADADADLDRRLDTVDERAGLVAERHALDALEDAMAAVPGMATPATAAALRHRRDELDECLSPGTSSPSTTARPEPAPRAPVS